MSLKPTGNKPSHLSSVEGVEIDQAFVDAKKNYIKFYENLLILIGVLDSGPVEIERRQKIFEVLHSVSIEHAFNLHPRELGFLKDCNLQYGVHNKLIKILNRRLEQAKKL